MARYWAAASARLGTAMATWLRRPINLAPVGGESADKPYKRLRNVTLPYTAPSAAAKNSATCARGAASARRLRQQHLGDRPLAPHVLYGRANCAPYGLAHELPVPAPVAGDAGYRALYGVAHDVDHLTPFRVDRRHAVEGDLGVRDLAPARARQHDDDDAGKGQRTPLAHGPVLARHQQLPVAEQPPNG